MFWDKERFRNLWYYLAPQKRALTNKKWGTLHPIDMSPRKRKGGGSETLCFEVVLGGGNLYLWFVSYLDTVG